MTSFWNTYTGLEASGQLLPARHWGIHGESRPVFLDSSAVGELLIVPLTLQGCGPTTVTVATKAIAI